MAAMKYKNFHQTNMLCYAIFLCYVDGGFSSVSTLQHTMLITSRQIVNLSIIKHSLSFLCKILLTQGVSVSLRERVFRKKLICQNGNQLWISSFIFVIRSIYNHSIFIDKLRIILISFDNYLGGQICNTRYIYVYGFIPFNQYHSFNSRSNAAQFFTNFVMFLYDARLSIQRMQIILYFFIHLAFPKILQF